MLLPILLCTALALGEPAPAVAQTAAEQPLSAIDLRQGRRLYYGGNALALASISLPFISLAVTFAACRDEGEGGGECWPGVLGIMAGTSFLVSATATGGAALSSRGLRKLQIPTIRIPLYTALAGLGLCQLARLGRRWLPWGTTVGLPWGTTVAVGTSVARVGAVTQLTMNLFQVHTAKRQGLQLSVAPAYQAEGGVGVALRAVW